VADDRIGISLLSLVAMVWPGTWGCAGFGFRPAWDACVRFYLRSNCLSICLEASGIWGQGATALRLGEQAKANGEAALLVSQQGSSLTTPQALVAVLLDPMPGGQCCLL